jgi:dephospho-CoA kinase
MQRPNKRKIILGVTGSFGSGKTTVARQLSAFGAKIIDADKIAHRIIKPGNRIYERIVKTFGNGILKNGKTIDRHKLSCIVFNNKNALKKLNSIMHPEIIRITRRQIKTARSRVVVLDVPLLIEAGLENIVDRLIVVKVNRKKQIERLLDKTSLSRTSILKRIHRQIPLSKKVRLADFVIDNSGTFGETKRQVENICKNMNLSLAAKE